MKNRIAIVCVAASLLASCSDADWDRSLNYVGISDGKPAPQRAQPVRRAEAAPQMAQQPRQAAAPTQLAPQAPTARPADPFCQAVATQDSQGGGFDQATQSRVYQTSYNQCVVMFVGGGR